MDDRPPRRRATRAELVIAGVCALVVGVLVRVAAELLGFR